MNLKTLVKQGLLKLEEGAAADGQGSSQKSKGGPKIPQEIRDGFKNRGKTFPHSDYEKFENASATWETVATRFNNKGLKCKVPAWIGDLKDLKPKKAKHFEAKPQSCLLSEVLDAVVGGEHKH